MSNKVVAMTNRQNRPEWADIVIIGNGIAGVTAALEARVLAPNATIAIITEQSHPTINTPALKQFAIGKMTQEQLLAFPPGTERAQRIHIINARVESIHSQGKYVGLRGGYGFGYGSLLLATGSVPNGLPAQLPGRDFDGVMTLHNLHDYLQLRRRLPEVEAAVVIGGGTHAIETAMGLLHHGIEVHWLIRGDTFLPKMLDRVASELVLGHVCNAGIRVYTETEVIGIVGRVGSVAGVVTNHHDMIPCQLALTCTGTSPVTSLAEHCDVPMLYKRGIYVDNSFRTSVRDIYAVGDVAARKNPVTGHYETEAQWYAAASHGRMVAATMTGYTERTATSPGVPWHATHLGELFMLTVGSPLSQLQGSVTLTDSGKKKYCRMAILDDRLIGYLSLGTTQPDSLAIKRLIDEGLSVRSVKKALLKGNFDARRYFSGWRARTAQEMVTSGKLPAIMGSSVQAPYNSRPIVVSSAMVTTPAQNMIDTPPLPMPVVPVVQHPVYASVGMRQTEPLRDEGQQGQQIQQSQQMQPVVVSEQPTIHQWEEVIHPVTGKQPVPAQVGACIAAKLLPLPARTVTRNLWSYSAKVPAVRAASTQESKTVQS
ncbi:MAG TPA: FAD-dependent oxidoreductase [Ktedonobacteraceae bacterium]|nr:FAD-dependent oxidoreductase [Ktedonobacteraceae bacterium]